MPRTDTDALRAQLRARLSEVGVSLRELDRRLGWGQSYSSQLLRKKPGVDLKVDQLYAMLEAAAIDPREFFATLHRPEEGTALVGEVEAALRRLGYEPQHAAGAQSGREEPRKPRRKP